uniref:Small glutamine-rich tetratricopeptide repeat-containing protein alpha n=1 Tax=Equus asinus TaxID=9793 RepID=A0A9L0J984_EQUAS
MDNKKRLAYAIIRFLHDQLRHGGLSSDAQESLEVAIQCLETAFGVTVEDSDLALPQTLPEIFEAAATGKEMPQDLRTPERTPPSEEDSAEAERLKTEGNEQMKVENFEAAVHFYGKAIELNPANAVYFCNRAAAYSKLGNYAGAVQDCERAICIDPSYSKAYGRMGLALSSLNKHTEAVAYYKKALELDPDNETYKSNLKIAELKLREAPSPTGGVGSFDIAGLLNNPSFMSMVRALPSLPPHGVPLQPPGPRLPCRCLLQARAARPQYRGWVTLWGAVLGTIGGRQHPWSPPIHCQELLQCDNHRCPQTLRCVPWGQHCPG